MTRISLLSMEKKYIRIAYSSDFSLFIYFSFSMDMRFTLGLDPGCQQGCRLRDPYGSFTCGHGRGVLAIVKRAISICPRTCRPAGADKDVDEGKKGSMYYFDLSRLSLASETRNDRDARRQPSHRLNSNDSKT